jgi:stage IV sporulation protein FB
MDFDIDLYPKKPILIEEKPKSNVWQTLLSILLFIVAFLFIFSDNISFIFHLVIVLLIHELGHFTMMKIFNYQHVRMLFVPLMGAFVQGKKEVYSQRQSLLVVGLGPFPGILIGAGLLYFSLSVHQGWMVDMGFLFLFLNLLNLIPIDPLDGGRLFNLLLHKRQDLFLLVFSFISSLALIGFGFFSEYWLTMIFGFLMAFRVRSLQKQYLLRKRFKEEGIKYETTYRDLSNEDYERIKTFLLIENNRIQEYLGYLKPDEAEQFLAHHVNDVLKTPVRKDAGIFFKLVLILCWIGLMLAPIILVISGADWINEHYAWYFEYLSTK